MKKLHPIRFGHLNFCILNLFSASNLEFRISPDSRLCSPTNSLDLLASNSRASEALRGLFGPQMGHDVNRLGHFVHRLGHFVYRLGPDVNRLGLFWPRLGHSKTP